MMESRYSYEVRPKMRLIIPGEKPITRPFTAQLTKAEVLNYMAKGAIIYRKFPNGSAEKVTGATLNRLHCDLDKIGTETQKQPVVSRTILTHEESVTEKSHYEMNRGQSVITVESKEEETNTSTDMEEVSLSDPVESSTPQLKWDKNKSQNHHNNKSNNKK